jgi:hypothetical protein
MQFSFIVKAASREALGAKLAAARAALTVSSTLRQCIINFPEMDGPHWTQVRVRKFDIQRDPKASTATINLELFAPDPLLYENTINEQTVYANLANLVGNTRTYPRVYPLSYTTGVLPFASVASSYASLQNNGSVASDWEAEIVGPCETPVFTNLETGQILAFNGSVPAGSTLRVSSRERTVFLDNASRYSWLASGSSWWLLEPGATRVRFTAHAQSGSAVLRFRSTSD